MSNIALLVDCHKIINWLQDRKKLRKDWYNYLKAAEEKLKTLLKDREWTINYPNLHDYINLHQHNFNYIDIDAFVELLLLTDIAQQKNMLFGYSDKRVKQWTTLKKYMESNVLNLLSVAKFIQQSLRFDLPAINKSIESLDNQLTTLKRKIDFNRNTIFQQTGALIKEKTILGIQDERQLKLQIEELIKVIIKKGPYQIKILEKMCQNPEIIKYLQQFRAINQNNQTPNQLEMLNYFVQFGDQFLQVYKDKSKKQIYSNSKKYQQFDNWKGENEWQIQIQGETKKQQLHLQKETIIESRQIRQQLLYDLSQLLYFYKGLKYELSTAGKGLGFQAQNFKVVSIVQSQAQIAITEIDTIISFLTSKKLTAPLQLKNSKKVYQVLVSQFGGYQANIKTMQSQIVGYKQQIQEMTQRRQQQAQKLSWLRAKVVKCKSKCEGWLTDLVKKQVKITGQINKLQ